MLVVECSGTPYEIGHTHGLHARPHIARSISFYTSLFAHNCSRTWPQVLLSAAPFATHAKTAWPAYHAELRGIADGAGVDLLSIVALNVRSEINFGLFSDGCTALSWNIAGRAWAGQNWDWMTEQKQNLIVLKIRQEGKPTIVQVTEAGIIGKIGFNSAGVGTLLNAIKVAGVDETRLPVHFGLRMVLESESVEEAVGKLEKYGMASSGHILIADGETAVGLEFTRATFARCGPDERGRVIHANHLLKEHVGQVDTVWLKDSIARVDTMTRITEGLEEPGWDDVSRLFEDEENYPGSICRFQTKETGSATLFNIVMDLKEKKAVVRLGRPTEVEETINLDI